MRRHTLFSDRNVSIRLPLINFLTDFLYTVHSPLRSNHVFSFFSTFRPNHNSLNNIVVENVSKINVKCTKQPDFILPSIRS